MSFVIFILILVALILVHEFGHFSVAKWFKVRVDEFGIFFPPKLFGKKFGETEYTFNSLPFGGFVRIFGENPGEGGGDPRALSSKNRSVQAAVILAGIVFNILFAWLILSMGYMAGFPSAPGRESFGEVRDVKVMIADIQADSPAIQAGLKPGDAIVAIETATGKITPTTAQEVTDFIAAHQEESHIITVARGNETENILVKPEGGIVEGRKAIGIQPAELGTLQLPPHLAVAQGALLTKDMVVATAQGLLGFFGRIVQGSADFSAVAGPIGIVALGGSSVEQGYVAIIFLTASISIALAIFNLLPIPGLDGGRLLFIIIEAIIRRPISQRLSVALTLAGFALLICLMLVVSYHDIARLTS